jgi:hypothetical protein
MRRVRALFLLPALLVALGPTRAAAQEAAASEPAEPDSIEDVKSKRLGFYFTLSLERMSALGQANAIGLKVDRPPFEGGATPAVGDIVNGDFRSRWDLGFKFGFRLRGSHGSIESSFFQWDENENLLTLAGDGKVIANTLASPDAGFFEDVGVLGATLPPDGSVLGFEAGFASEGAEATDRSSDGAEDLNYNGQADFIRFTTANRIVGSMHTDFQKFDVDWVKPVKRLRRFTLASRMGVRLASVTQEMDLAYRDVGAFAVYIDNEGENGNVSERTNVPTCLTGQTTVVDGDGDGETQQADNEADGDGFMDGDCDTVIFDRLESVETISEDRIVAAIDTSGIGLTLGLDGQVQLAPKWRLVGGMSVSAMSSKTEWRYRETFVSERDRYLNFIDWDFDNNGLFDNRDFDFARDCISADPADCEPNTADNNVLNPRATQFVDLTGRVRQGAERSRVNSRIAGQAEPRGVNPGAFDATAGNATRLRVGDPVPESERNRDVLREVTLLRDQRGESSGFTPILDLNVGLEFQFSAFAHVGFGLRSTRWFDAGRFRDLANDIVAGREPDASGDFGATGGYLVITVVPR